MRRVLLTIGAVPLGGLLLFVVAGNGLELEGVAVAGVGLIALLSALLLT
jgi:hypothetical protein